MAGPIGEPAEKDKHHHPRPIAGCCFQATGRDHWLRIAEACRCHHANRPATEYTAKIDVHPKYRGRGHNFWINWPGFLVWAPAWHGYIYEINWDMDLTLTAGTNSVPLEKFSLPIFSTSASRHHRTWSELAGGIRHNPMVSGIFWMHSTRMLRRWL